MLTALVFFAILSILVVVHELGHFLVARFFGVRVEEFGFGLPPRLFGKKIRGTLYSLNLLPIGGFVKLAGEDAEDIDREKHGLKSKTTRSHYFWAKSKKQRIAILLAGVVMNFFLAVGITAFLLSYGIVEPAGRVHIESVTKNSPAEKAGLVAGDIIFELVVTEDKKPLVVTPSKTEEVVSTIQKHAGELVSMTVIRASEKVDLKVTPRKNPPSGEGALGVLLNHYERRKYPIQEFPWKSLEITFNRSWQMISSIGNLLGRLVTGQQVKSEEVSGPVGIAKVVGDSMKYGWEAVLEMVSILSLNLAIFNVLPIPALDGGRIMFVVLEKISKKSRPALERTINQIGMLILLALLLVITINDILRIVKG